MPKKITPAEKEKPTRDEVAVKVKAVFKRLKEQQASPEHLAFVAAVEANKGLVALDGLALRDLINLEGQIPHDSQHPDAILARECCANVREQQSEIKAGYWLRRGMVAFKDLQLWDDAIKGEKFGNKGRGAGKWRKFIATQLKKNPSAKNAELWAAAKAKNYAGWDFYDSPTKYAMGPDGEIGFARFCNIAAEERGKAEL